LVNGSFKRATRPAFLIDADPGRRRRPERFALGRELGHLLGRLDVAAEQDHAAEVELTASDRSSTGTLVPGMLPIKYCPMSRRVAKGMLLREL
jgi:hypothetical protein